MENTPHAEAARREHEVSYQPIHPLKIELTSLDVREWSDFTVIVDAGRFRENLLEALGFNPSSHGSLCHQWVETRRHFDFFCVVKLTIAEGTAAKRLKGLH